MDSASGVYVFDVTRGEWLPTPVEGLQNDEKFDSRPYLLQMSKNEQDNKLALVSYGQRCDDSHIPTSPYCEVHCSKFILHRCIGTDNGTQLASFFARLLSKGVARLDDNTTTVLNCASASGAYMQFS